MPHIWDYKIDSLRKQVANDIATFKLEKERLYNLRIKDVEDLQLRDRNVIINWSRASIADYNEKLDDMEKIESPSTEEKKIMQQLMELISLGDHIGDIQGQMEKRLDAKFGKMVVPRKRETSGATAHSASGPRRAASPASQSAPSLFKPKNDAPAPVIKQPVSKSLPTTSSPKVKPLSVAGSHAHSEKATDSDASVKVDMDSTSVHSHGDLDPKGIYARLGLTPAASMIDIKKAARRMKLTLHPDKNNNDPNAGVRFTEFTALYGATLENEEIRGLYDSIMPG